MSSVFTDEKEVYKTFYHGPTNFTSPRPPSHPPYTKASLPTQRMQIAGTGHTAVFQLLNFELLVKFNF